MSKPITDRSYGSYKIKIICVGQIRMADNLPILQKTKLGWVASSGHSIDRNGHSSLTVL